MAVIKANKYNILIAFFVALGSFTYGYNSSVTAGVVGLPSFFAYMKIDTSTSQGNALFGAINGVYLAGGAFGCWTLAWLADTVGRVRTIQAVTVICIVSAAIQCGSVHVGMFLAGRLVNGFGVGMINTLIPLYQSEISPPSQRGRLVGLHGAILVAGYSCGGWTSYGAYFATNKELQWRLPLGIQLLAPIALLIGSPWLPESPRWLIGHGREEQGMTVLSNLHRTAEDPDASGAHVEFREIQNQIHIEAEERIDTLWKCLCTPDVRRRMIYGFCLQWLLQSTGVLVVFNYQTVLYANLGVAGSTPLLLLSIYNVVAAIFNYVCSLVLDRFGRINIITFGIAGCIADLILYTALVAEFANTTNRVGNGFAILALFLFAVFYGFLDSASYVYCSEIFPTSVRAHGMGFAVSGLFLSNILYTQVAPTAFDTIGWKFFLVFIIVPAAGLVPFRLFYPETKLLSLEEVSYLFGNTAPPSGDEKQQVQSDREPRVSETEEPVVVRGA
ncbi:hypothetical protein SEUCBS139899_009964 [Sporothrix eucalyptigena]